MNPHRGDTVIQVGDEEYILCYDLNACAEVMDKLGLDDLEDLAEKGMGETGFNLKDLIFILYAGLVRNHPELTEQDVGGLEWDLDDVGSKIGESFQKGLMRNTEPGVEKKVTRKKRHGTGKRSSSGRTKQA